MAKFNLYDLDIIASLKGWVIGLRNLSFEDNFKGYEWEGEIEAGEEVKIQHNLKVIPTRFIITDATGVGTIVRGSERATITYFYLQNTATNTTFKGKILIMP